MSPIAKERILSYVSESRLAQGLPERVADPAVLSAIAVLLRTGVRPDTEGNQPEPIAGADPVAASS